MDHIPDDLLELQARFDQWRANRKYNREPIPDQLRDAALEMKRRYPPSLLQRVLKIQLCRLMPKAKTNARRSKRQQAQTASSSCSRLKPRSPQNLWLLKLRLPIVCNWNGPMVRV